MADPDHDLDRATGLVTAARRVGRLPLQGDPGEGAGVLEETNVDQAALWTAAVAAVIALTSSGGRYGWLSCGIGTALAFLIAAYYRPSSAMVGQRDRITKAGAFGAIAGLVTAMILSWPIQELVGTPGHCTRGWQGDEAQVDECAGATASDWVGLAWAGAGLILASLHWWRVRPASAPEPTS